MIKNRREESSSQKKSTLPALLSYGLGTFFLGLLLGIAAGLSRSPVVGILIPLLFSILGGAGSLYLSTADMEAPAFSRRTRIVGVFMVIVAISVMLGSVYGITVRTGV
jgi:hypothetical protein